MAKKDDGVEKINEMFDIDSELTTIVENKILPQRIAEKIGEKIKENNIQISKEQLYQLVDKIQSVIQTYGKTGFSGRDKITTYEETGDMKKLVETIEKLEDRIETIEESNLKGVKGVTGRLVKTKDIKTREKVDMSLLEEMEPLIEIPNDPESIIVLMKWLQCLVDKLGKNQLPDVLGYYVDIDWISDDVRLDMIKYSKGITDEKKTEGKSTASLSTKDHIQSLLFIQKLKGMQFDDRFIFRIDREMEKMAKSIEDYQFK